MEGFIGVHLGAGQHSNSHEGAYRKLIDKACRKAIHVLQQGGSALNACTAATAVLENSPLTNAGIGSNCTWDGTVECDASVMNGTTLSFGAVGAVQGVKNPVLLAERLCENQNQILSLGRIPPSFLVGDGALQYAKDVKITTVNPQSLVTEKQKKRHTCYREKVSKFEASKLLGCSLDTVGAVCMDHKGQVAAACSSGGIALKHCGRVGQAGVYGCGCWAQDAQGKSSAVASCSSGGGEHLIRTMLAREVALAVQEDVCAVTALSQAMYSKFLMSLFLRIPRKEVITCLWFWLQENKLQNDFIQELIQLTQSILTIYKMFLKNLEV